MATDYGPRIRAARGFAGLSQGALASKLGREVQWVKRREAGDQEPQAGDLLAIAAATDVPIAFLEHGFTARVAEDPDLAERVEALEAKLQAALALARTRDERVTNGAAALGEVAKDVADLRVAIGALTGQLARQGQAIQELRAGDRRTAHPPDDSPP